MQPIRVMSPNRNVYSSYKKLQESYLDRICNDNLNNIFLLKVFIGSQLKRYRESTKSIKLAQKIFIAYNRRKKQIFFGTSGRILLFIFYVNPLIAKFIILLKRKIFN